MTEKPIRADDPPETLGPSLRENGHWTLDKRLNVSHLVATAAIIIAVFTWSGKIDTRISLIEQAQAQQALRDQRQDDESKAATLIVRGDLRDINNKLDRLIETKR